ncbi:MAG: hypothetical protein RBS58_09450 [Syntrophales bacterium]|nr:hypothetical protein [Syntrophales bacterium]
MAAAGAAAILKAKLDDPGSDIREFFGYFRNQAGTGNQDGREI